LKGEGETTAKTDLLFKSLPPQKTRKAFCPTPIRLQLKKTALWAIRENIQVEVKNGGSEIPQRGDRYSRKQRKYQAILNQILPLLLLDESLHSRTNFPKRKLHKDASR
jgi:hypothetical protein